MTSTALRQAPWATRFLDTGLALLMALGVVYGLIGVVIGLTADETFAGFATLVGLVVIALTAPGLVLLVAGLVRRSRYGAGWSLLLAGRVASGAVLLFTAWWFWPWF